MATIRTVTIRAKAKAGQLDDLSIEPIGIRMKGAGRNEELLWKSIGGRITSFTIDFNYPEGTPFAWTSKTSASKKVESGQPTAGGAYPTPYAYTIKVDLKAKGKHPARTIVIDPEVVFDDNTPPPGSGGGKKKKKKSGKKKKGGKGKKAAKRKAPRRRPAKKAAKKK